MDSFSKTIKSYLNDSLKYIPSQVIPAVAGFLSIYVYTRILQPAGYGSYVLILTSVNLLSSLIFSWLNQSGIRFFQKYKKMQKDDFFISTALIAMISILFILSFVWFLIAFTADFKPLCETVLIAYALFCSISIYNLLLVFLKADRKIVKFGIYSCIYSLLSLTLALIIISLFEFDQRGVILALIMVSSILLLFELVSVKNQKKLKLTHFSFAILKENWQYGAPMIGVTVGAMVLSVSDRYMIEWLLGTDAVGIYSAGYAIAERSIRGIASILMIAATPIIFKTHTEFGDTKTRQLIHKMLKTYIMVLLPAVCGLSFLSGAVVEMLLGDLFISASQVIMWVAAGIFFHTLGLYFNLSFQLKNKTLQLFHSYMFAAILNIVLNMYFIPKFGVIGAAWATCISYFLYAITTWVSGTRLLRIDVPWLTIVKVSLSICLMIKVIMIFELYLVSNYTMVITSVIVGAIVYLVSLFACKRDSLMRQ